MRWCERQWGRRDLFLPSLVWMVIILAVCGIVGLLAISIVHAQTFYSTDEGTGIAVELMPGVTYFAGPRSGFAIETMPGVTRYDVHDADLNSSRGTFYDLSSTWNTRDRAPSVLDRPSPLERESLLTPRRSWEDRR